MKPMIILSLTILVYGCNGIGPVLSPFAYQTWAGTFDINERFSDGSIRIRRGTVAIRFAENTYSYTAEMNVTLSIVGQTPTNTFYLIRNHGEFETMSGVITLSDYVDPSMKPFWTPSLDLWGQYQYAFVGQMVTFKQATYGQSTVLVLQNRKSLKLFN
jgi:hypothetical protein